MGGSWTLLITVFHIASFGGATMAQTLDDEKQRCFVDHSDAERSIAGCTGAIQSGQLTTVDRAVAFTNRGGAYLTEGQIALAIQDFDQAIRLDPNDATAFNNRCWARAVLGQPRQAMADCDQSLRLQPNNTNAR